MNFLRYLALTILWIASCQALPTTFPPPLQILPPESILKKLLERKNHLTDFKSFVRTTISRNGSIQTLKQVFLIKNSRFIRIDTLSLFGNPISIFIHNPQKTLIYDPAKNRTFHGSDVWEVVKRVIGTSLDFDETLALFSGNIPQLERLKLESARFDEEKKYYKLEMQNPVNQTRFYIEVDAILFIPIRLEKQFGSSLMYSAQWEDYQGIDGYFFAHRVTISRPDPEETLTVKYRQPKINSGVPKSAFTVVLEDS